MSFILLLAFLFFMGSLTGWGIELLYRRFVSQKKWVNPGFLSGPYLPIYGFGLVGSQVFSAKGYGRFFLNRPISDPEPGRCIDWHAGVMTYP